jgi:membrane protease YdiL (CAAX protease family)
MTPPTSPEAAGARETWRLAAVTLVWLACARYLERAGDAFVPDAWKAKIQLQTFLIACQLTWTAVGLGLAFALLSRPREALAVLLPRPRGIAAAALLAPAAYVGSAAVAFQAALPTLMAELRERGSGASRENAGEFGRMLQQGPTLATMIWGVVLAAVTEELLFRGALWSLVERIARHLDAPAAGPRGRLRAAVPAIAATVAAAVVFSSMHGNLAGGVGILRVVSTLCLGLACGAARGATGTLAAPLAIHLINNAVALGPARGWFGRAPEPLFDWLPVPSALVGVAAAGVGGAAVVWIGSTIARRRAERDRALQADD